jgi:hypothetical protein
LEKPAFSFDWPLACFCASLISTTLKLIEAGHPLLNDGQLVCRPFTICSINGQTVSRACVDFFGPHPTRKRAGRLSQPHGAATFRKLVTPTSASVSYPHSSVCSGAGILDLFGLGLAGAFAARRWRKGNYFNAFNTGLPPSDRSASLKLALHSGSASPR